MGAAHQEALVLLKKPEIPINEEQPFSDDKLDRELYAQNLKRLIHNIKEPFVICLNSQWGTGKTFFIKRFEKTLKNDFKTIYYNAWENDYSDDAFISLVSEVRSSLQKYNTDERPIISKLEKLKDIGGKIAKDTLPLALSVGVKLATGGMVNYKDITEEIAEYSKEYAKERIDKYEAAKCSITDFKEELSSIVKDINNGRPLVFIIDELDRCRPTFAIELLEKAKHIFNVPGIVFIICIDKEQISKSISVIYGNGFDKEGYLRRFFDFEIQFPLVSYEKYVWSLFEQYGFKNYFSPRCEYRELQNDYKEFTDSLIVLFQIFNYSPRAVEQCLSRLSAVFRATIVNGYLEPILLSALLLLREQNYDVYKEYIDGICGYKKVMNYIIECSKRYIIKEEYSYILKVLPLYLLFFDKNFSENEDAKTKLEAEKNIDMIMYDAEMNKLKWKFPRTSINYFVEKIELISFFQQKQSPY